MATLPPSVQHLLDLTAELTTVTHTLASARLRLDALADLIVALDSPHTLPGELAAKVAIAASDVDAYAAREAELLAALSGHSVAVAETVPVRVRYYP